MLDKEYIDDQINYILSGNETDDKFIEKKIENALQNSYLKGVRVVEELVLKGLYQANSLDYQRPKK